MDTHRLTIARSARFATLGSLAGDAREVWIACHGYAQLAHRFLRSFAALAEPSRLIVAPEALNRFYIERPGMPHTELKVGATWMTREDRDAEISDYVAYLDAVHAKVTPPAARVTVFGFSQGVATAARWVALGVSRVDHLVLWAGAIPEDIDLGAGAAGAGGLRVTLVLGKQDEFADWAKVDEQVTRLVQQGITPDVHSFEGGHRLDDDVLRRIAGGT